MREEGKTLPRLITNLHPLEKSAVLQLTKQIVESHSASIKSISLYSTGLRNDRGFEEVEVLILTREEDLKLEDKVLDIVAEVVVDTGVYLTVKTFSEQQFKSFSRVGVSFVDRIKETGVPLYAPSVR